MNILHHFTAQHVILRSRTPDVQKLSIQIWFLNFFKIDFSKPWVFKIANLSHFTPRTLNYKSFSQGKQSGYLDIDFKDFISKLFAKRILNLFTNFLHLLYPYFCPEKPIFPNSWKQIMFYLVFSNKWSGTRLWTSIILRLSGKLSYSQAGPTRSSYQFANSSFFIIYLFIYF